MEEIGIGEFSRRSRLSLKALRLYDERGVLVPARVDQASGYRYYDTAQLDQARLVVMMRQLQLPLATVRELLACDPADAAARIAEYWRGAEAAHDERRQLADHLVSWLCGKRPVRYDFAMREMPERSLLCLKRRVDEQRVWAFGKEFMAILRERRLPTIEGRAGGPFCIYWAWVSADSDGPVEWCKPVPQARAHALAEQYPDLTLRTEPAHLEAFFPVPVGTSAVQFELTVGSLEGWLQEQAHEHEGDRLSLTPEELGLRFTYFAPGPVTGMTVPDDYCDFAVPFAVER